MAPQSPQRSSRRNKVLRGWLVTHTHQDLAPQTPATIPHRTWFCGEPNSTSSRGCVELSDPSRGTAMGTPPLRPETLLKIPDVCFPEAHHGLEKRGGMNAGKGPCLTQQGAPWGLSWDLERHKEPALQLPDVLAQ